MKTLFIHFSDIHLNEPFNSEDAYDHLLDAVSPSLEKVDRVFLLFTGDMARKAKDEEICYFDDFISRFKNAVQEQTGRDVELLIVPGNHDIQLSDQYNVDELVDSNKEQLDSLACESVKNMSCCLSICKKHGCFVKNPFVSIKTFDSPNVIYRFTLINSAPLSSLKKNDKGQHHIPASNMKFDTSVCHKKKTVDVLLSHHRPDWFNEDTLERLNDYLDNNVSIAFFGHEHIPSSDTHGKNGRIVLVSRGGELQPKNNKILGSFSLLILDEDTFLAEETVVSINYQSGEIQYSEPVSQSVRYSEKYHIDEGFLKCFSKSPLKNGEGSLLDTFVFPALSQETIRNDILNIESALNKAKEKGLMVLCGGSKSGKTTLLKALFLNLQKEFPCVFLKATPELSNNIERNIKDAFYDIYGEDHSLWTNYKNSKKSEKAIFIDDFGSLRKRSIKEQCLKYCQEHFGTVVLGYLDNSQPLDSLEDKILFDDESIYKIEGLTAKNRLTLVNNICRLKGLPLQDAGKIGAVYEEMSASSKILDFIDPDYAVQLIESIIDNKLYVERTVFDAFSAVFDTSINNDIISAGSKENLDGVLAVLRELAHSVWANNQAILFDESEIRKSFDYCKDRGLIKTDYFNFMDIILSSGVIAKRGDDQYRFKRNSHLSYFVAKSIAVNMNRGKTDDLVTLEDHIEVGINSDVLLFLCYDLSRIDVILSIKDKLLELLSPYEEMDFENKNNRILQGVSLIPEESGKNKVTKKEAIEKEDEAERKSISSERKNEERVFEEEETDEEVKRVVVCVKYIEILSKAGGSFPGILEDGERTELTKAIVSSINKVLQVLFNPDEDTVAEYSRLLDEYKKVEVERIRESSSGDVESRISEINNIKVEDFLFGILLKVLTLFDSAFANCLASKHSMKAISSLSSDKFTHIVFKLYSYLYYGNFDRFIKELKTAYDTFEKQRGDNMFKFFGRLYVLKNHCSNDEIDKIASLTGLRKNYLLSIASRD